MGWKRSRYPISSKKHHILRYHWYLGIYIYTHTYRIKERAALYVVKVVALVFDDDDFDDDDEDFEQTSTKKARFFFEDIIVVVVVVVVVIFIDEY